MYTNAASNPILIVGAGPVGLVAATMLARAGLAVTIVEASRALPRDLRASTFHPPTLDMLEPLGVVEGLVAEGLVCRHWQFRDRDKGVVATFDLGLLASDTNHPYRLQCEQWRLTDMLRDLLVELGTVEIIYDAVATAVTQDEDAVELTVASPDGASRVLRGAYLIGADGARSAIRKALGVAFDGMTIPEIFLAMATTHDFSASFADLAPIAYLTDPDEWAVLLRTVSVWRVLLPTDPGQSEAQIKDPATIERRLQALAPKQGHYEVVHSTAYRVHERVAERYRVGRVFLAGDAAHVNNPLGGMGMNGGIHDAVNLAQALTAVTRGASPALLGRYERQRRRVAIEAVQAQTVRNRRMMAERAPEARQAHHEELRRTSEDLAAHRAFLLRSSMIQSLRDLEHTE